ncbi:nuclease EXOG, mitochondrial-like [Watersipora subatra]|uniref:nuclease EXOG, mitochondrial-like n=1 Tax=Watersipora subatra TaxID=2589382 RepID=UPI00355BDE98
MFSTAFGSSARGFIGGAVITASISYAILHRQTPDKPVTGHVPEKFPFGEPKDMRRTLHYSGHTVYYDFAKKQPLWVSQVLTKESLKGKANRRQSKFRRDGQIPEAFSADNADYVSSGWSRGHMAAAADFKHSQEAMDDTFFLTNIVPQDGDNNSGFWNRLEMYCRDLTKKFDVVYIITGPIYHVNMDDDHVNKDDDHVNKNDDHVNMARNYVKYEVIGNNNVPVPTHLYKVIVAFDEGESKRAMGAFIVPNRPISKEEINLAKYQVGRDHLQLLTGFDFLPELAADKTCDLCTAKGDSCLLKNWKDVEIYFAKRNLQFAASQQDIDAVTKLLKKKNIKVDNNMRALIKSKQIEMNENEAPIKGIAQS